ncbi:MAG: hypothetical protein VX262_03380, partial [Acidobacteriota bacterium]|nr:hypothetical protein [Acidobacteriota bacterium]
MSTLCPVSTANMRDSPDICVKPITRHTSLARPKIKQPNISAIAMLMVGIIGLDSGEHTLSAQTP